MRRKESEFENLDPKSFEAQIEALVKDVKKDSSKLDKLQKKKNELEVIAIRKYKIYSFELSDYFDLHLPSYFYRILNNRCPKLI